MRYSIPAAIEAVQSRLRGIAERYDGDIPKTLEAFDQEHGICGKYDGQLVLLDYDQLRVKWTEYYGHVCRGLILDPFDNWDVVAFGLPKFFNHGEHYAADIDWASARCLEKCDGTMVQRFWNPYAGEFQYSTRFQLPGDLARNKCSGLSDMTWLQLIEKSIGGFLFDQPTNVTYVLEVMSPLNRIVVAHERPHFKLLAVRRIDSPPYPEIEVPSIHPRAPLSIDYVRDAGEAQALADGLPGTMSEGFVVVDKDFNRVKVKNANYVQLHRLKDGINSVGAVIMLARSNDYEEVTVHFPEFVKPIEIAKAVIDDVVEKHTRAYEDILREEPETQKAFALCTKVHSCVTIPSLLFTVRAGKQPTIRDALYAMRENSFIDIVKSRLPPEFVQMCMLPPNNPPPKGMAIDV
jgi:hypothetical protein